jgi:hypothetical protein
VQYRNEDKNYAYRCAGSEVGFELCSVVPHWSERFSYHGFALASDYEDDYNRR